MSSIQRKVTIGYAYLKHYTKNALKPIRYGLPDKKDGLANTFNHRLAQVYELHCNLHWMGLKHYDRNCKLAEAAIKNREYWAGPSNIIAKEFFGNDNAKFEEFARSIAGKSCMEIGSGPMPMLSYFWWAGEKHVIDPLIAKYNEEAIRRGHGDLYTGIYIYPECAEKYHTELFYDIKGAIICHNALDHCQRPYDIIDNMSRYAAPGCKLLLWTDLWHLKGHDEGHTNITQSRADFIKKIRDAGFNIVYEFDVKERPSINYGCVAVKV